jgi:hypothetical protein
MKIGFNFYTFSQTGQKDTFPQSWHFFRFNLFLSPYLHHSKHMPQKNLSPMTLNILKAISYIFRFHNIPHLFVNLFECFSYKCFLFPVDDLYQRFKTREKYCLIILVDFEGFWNWLFVLYFLWHFLGLCFRAFSLSF